MTERADLLPKRDERTRAPGPRQTSGHVGSVTAGGAPMRFVGTSTNRGWARWLGRWRSSMGRNDGVPGRRVGGRGRMRDDVGGPGAPEPSEPPRGRQPSAAGLGVLRSVRAANDRATPPGVPADLDRRRRAPVGRGRSGAHLGQLAVARRLRRPVAHRVHGATSGSFIDLEEDLKFWVNDGLMALFFLVVGLEIKRELVTGELRQLRAAILPVLAAIGGMVVPAPAVPGDRRRRRTPAAGASRWPPTSRSRWAR